MMIGRSSENAGTAGSPRQLYGTRVVISGGARTGGKLDQHLAQLPGLGHPLRKREPRGAIAEREIGTVRIEAGELPGTVRLAEQPGGVEPAGFAVVGVHVLDRVSLGGDQVVGAGEIGAH